MTRFATWLILALIAVVVVGALILTAVPSLAQGIPCYQHEVVQAGLAAKFGETRHGMGLSSPTQIMEL